MLESLNKQIKNNEWGKILVVHYGYWICFIDIQNESNSIFFKKSLKNIWNLKKLWYIIFVDWENQINTAG
jgi:hypothetical protein